MKKLKYYLNLQYTTRINKNADEPYFAEIEELSGCMIESDSEKEVLNELTDAKKVWFAEALRRGLDIPEPTEDEFSRRFNVKVLKFLNKRLDYRAKREGVSLLILLWLLSLQLSKLIWFNCDD